LIKDLRQLIEAICQVDGKEISLYDESFLLKSLETRLTLTSSKTAAEYLARLNDDKTEAGEFNRSLNITFSEFFRNPLAFALLEHLILPRLIEEKSGREEIRIWSAGCAAGQEIYSIAILLDELSYTRGKPISLRMFATDRSETELELARKGVYDYAAVQHVRLKHVRAYFSQKGENFFIIDRFKDSIDFSLHDLLDQHSASPPASIFGDFDIVFCSNLLFYYRPEIQQLILGQVYRSLSKNGCLVTGEAEGAIVEKTGAFSMIAPLATVYKKRFPAEGFWKSMR
jgi:chemotaxis protein methyltransferase CheR